MDLVQLLSNLLLKTGTGTAELFTSAELVAFENCPNVSAAQRPTQFFIHYLILTVPREKEKYLRPW